MCWESGTVTLTMAMPITHPSPHSAIQLQKLQDMLPASGTLVHPNSYMNS